MDNDEGRLDTCSIVTLRRLVTFVDDIFVFRAVWFVLPVVTTWNQCNYRTLRLVSPSCLLVLTLVKSITSDSFGNGVEYLQPRTTIVQILHLFLSYSPLLLSRRNETLYLAICQWGHKHFLSCCIKECSSAALFLIINRLQQAHFQSSLVIESI